MAHTLHLVSTRKKFQPRREPYWGAPLDKGLHLGVRKLDDGTCTWVARLRGDDGGQRYRYHALGQVTPDFEYAAAKKAAEQWAKGAVRGVAVDGPKTVKDACEAYVAALLANTANSKKLFSNRDEEARKAAAHDAKMRFERHVYGRDGSAAIPAHSIARVRLDRLREEQLKEWRSGLGGSAAHQNRNWTTLRAALNLAVKKRLVGADASTEWLEVRQHHIAKNEGRRTLYLTRKERRALIDACESPGLRDLVELAALTGARPGEVAKAKRSAFDQRAGTLWFQKGKTAARTVHLVPAAVVLCKRLSKSKLPDAPLVMQDDGKPWVRWDWDELIREAAKKAKLPRGVVLYTMRHCWITDACRAGMPINEIAALTGTSIAMIESNYLKDLRDKDMHGRLKALPLP